MLSAMATDFFEHSPVLIFPMLALTIFVSVFLFIVLRTYGKKSTHLSYVATLPLDDESSAKKEKV